MKQRLFNPFIYLAGGKALLLGVLAMGVTAIVASFSGVHFDGVLDMHKFFAPSPPALFFIEPLVDWLCATIIFYLAGRIFSTSAIRIIDVAGTMAFARWPMIFAALLGFTFKAISLTALHDIGKHMDMILAASIGAFAAIPFIIWMIALMFNAFSVSCNLKGAKAIWIFIGALLIAEVIAGLTCHFVHHHINA